MTMDEPVSSDILKKLVTFILWAIVSLSVVGWGLKLWPLMTSRPLSISAQSAQMSQANGEISTPNSSSQLSTGPSVGTLLGAETKVQQKAPDLALARLGLVGVIQSGDGQGVALISLDAQTPKPYRVGAVVGDSLILVSVDAKSVNFKVAGDDSSSNVPSTTASTSSPLLRLELPKKMGLQAQISPKSGGLNSESKSGISNTPSATNMGGGAESANTSNASSAASAANPSIPGLVAGPGPGPGPSARSGPKNQ